MNARKIEPGKLGLSSAVRFNASQCKVRFWRRMETLGKEGGCTSFTFSHMWKHIQAGMQSPVEQQQSCNRQYGLGCLTSETMSRNRVINTISIKIPCLLPLSPTVDGADKLECFHSRLRRVREDLKNWRGQEDWKKMWIRSSTFVCCSKGPCPPLLDEIKKLPS